MTIQMTREQYNKVYGTPPVLTASSSLDITPAPVRMTRAEYESKYAPTPTALENVVAGKAAFPAQPDASIVSNSMRSIGNLPGAAFNLVKNTVMPIAKVPGAVVDTADDIGVSNTVNALNPVNLAITALKGGFKMWETAGEEIYKNLEKNVLGADSVTKGVVISAGEGLSKLAETVINDPTLVPSLLYAPKIAKGPDFVSDVARPITKTVNEVASPIIQGAKDARIQSIISKRQEELFNIENNYATTRKANDFTKDAGEASRKRIAQTDVLVDAVDTDGTIRTKQPGGAVEKYRAQTVDGVEDVVRNNLVRESKTITIPEIKNYLTRAVADSGLEGADLVTALRGIEKELQGLSLRADELGRVDLSKIHDTKISTTNQINYLTDAKPTVTFRKAKASAYKTIVEDKSDFNVKEVNSVLAQYYQDIERLERLDGKKVKGGRLGKYFAQLSGTAIGGAAGTIAGAPGAAIGGIIGGEVAGAIRGNAMSKSFGKTTGKVAPKSEIIAKAVTDAELPKGRPLTSPDPKLVFPENVPKTPATAKLEKQIDENIKAQEIAVQAGDFTLVAALKEVYDVLVEQMKEIVKATIESVKNPTIGLSIKSTVTPKLVAGKIDKEDFNKIVQFIDDPQAALLDDSIMRMIEDIGIGKADQNTQVQFLKDVVDEYEGVAEKAINPMIPNLKEEAKKYKSAEEFVKAQGTTLYHGGTKIDEVGSMSSRWKAFYMSDNSSYAKSYGGSKSVLNEIFISPNAKLVDLRKPTDEMISQLDQITRGRTTGKTFNIQKPDGTYLGVPEVLDAPDFGSYTQKQVIEGIKQGKAHFAEEPAIKEALKKLGYDGMITQESKFGANYGVWNKNVLKTRTQLEDIWNKANAKPTPLNKKPNVLEKTVLKKSEPLEVEAKKYKSAEEFVKAGIYSPARDSGARGAIRNEIEKIAETRKADTLRPNPNNPQLDKSTINIKAEDIAEGKRPYVLVEGDMIIDGHHAFEAYKKAGIEDIPVVTRDQLTEIWNKANKP